MVFARFLGVSAAYLLPRFLHGVVHLLLPFFVIKRVARGCPGAELRPATSQTLKLLAGGQASHESFVATPASWQISGPPPVFLAKH